MPLFFAFGVSGALASVASPLVAPSVLAALPTDSLASLAPTTPSTRPPSPRASLGCSALTADSDFHFLEDVRNNTVSSEWFWALDPAQFERLGPHAYVGAVRFLMTI